MSASLTPTTASPPSGVQSATGLLALMTALTGIATDINPGGQLRTLAESIGAVTDEQGAAAVAYGLQALAYGAMSLFGVQQAQATAATGTVVVATSLPLSGAFNAPQAIAIPSGTLVQTVGGVQFATTAAATLASGTSSVSVGIVATTAGAIGNVPSGTIYGTPLTPVGYPVYATNSVPTGGGADAGTQSQAIALFTAKAVSLGLSSPDAVADACIGVIATGTGETVLFSSCYEPWIAAGSGMGSGTAGFTVFIDNGTGGASPSLVAAVTNFLSGSSPTVPVSALTQSGYRPAGVPFLVSGVTPVYCSAVVSGALIPGLVASGNVATTVTSGVTAYFNSIGIASGVGSLPQTTITAAYQPQIAAAVGDAAAGAFSSLSVNLYYSGSSTPVALVSGAIGTRVILAGLAVGIS